jgi:hypothetical protein
MNAAETFRETEKAVPFSTRAFSGKAFDHSLGRGAFGGSVIVPNWAFDVSRSMTRLSPARQKPLKIPSTEYHVARSYSALPARVCRLIRTESDRVWWSYSTGAFSPNGRAFVPRVDFRLQSTERLPARLAATAARWLKFVINA